MLKCKYISIKLEQQEIPSWKGIGSFVELHGLVLDGEVWLLGMVSIEFVLASNIIKCLMVRVENELIFHYVVTLMLKWLNDGIEFLVIGEMPSLGIT